MFHTLMKMSEFFFTCGGKRGETLDTLAWVCLGPSSPVACGAHVHGEGAGGEGGHPREERQVGEDGQGCTVLRGGPEQHPLALQQAPKGTVQMTHAHARSHARMHAHLTLSDVLSLSGRQMTRTRTHAYMCTHAYI